ncbi:MAG TPA: hypothetical protein DCW90_14945 [Lachnospiraceae bacterium]|nr:hypothetical protein [Lachnospiraceae bacterium]
MKKMLVLDIDGTCINDNYEVSKELEQTVARIKQDNLVYIATGRSLSDAYQIYKTFDLDNNIICHNGGLVYDLKNSKAMFKKCIAQADEILKFLFQHEKEYAIDNIVLSRENETYLLSNENQYLQGIMVEKELPYFYEGRDLEQICDIQRIIISISPEYCNKVKEIIMANYQDIIVCGWKGREDIIDISVGKVNKWDAIKIIAEENHIEEKDIIAIGDAGTDIELIKNSGIGVCMLNGVKEAKDVADYVTAYDNNENGVYQFLTEHYDDLFNGETQEYRSCTYIEKLHMNFNGVNGHQSGADTDGCIELCCLSLAPGVKLEDSPETSIQNIIAERNRIMEESKQSTYLTTCAKCPFFNPMKSKDDGHVHFVNINMYPAPCQSKCIYCVVHSSDSGKFDYSRNGKAYENMFSAIECALKSGIIAPDALWQVASGEVTIHPFKERIYELMADKTSKFLTNCFKFDEELATILERNPKAVINLSIDAGTVETWFKVKGVNNFDTVLQNLNRYSSKCSNPEQITLKYIVLPGVNDNLEDYQALAQIMKSLHIKELIISRDNRLRFEKMILEHEMQIEWKGNKKKNTTDIAIEILQDTMQKAGIKTSFGEFWPDECKD